jgi:hypothetical protein
VKFLKISSKIVQFIVFLISGLVLAVTTMYQILWCIWGAPVYPTQIVALLSSLGLVVASFLILRKPSLGRTVAIITLGGVGTWWLPAVVYCAIHHDSMESRYYFALFIYFIAIGFALLYPKPIKFGWIWFLALIALTLGAMITWGYW